MLKRWKAAKRVADREQQRAKRNADREQERVRREAANREHGLCKLPAELLFMIFEHLARAGEGLPLLFGRYSAPLPDMPRYFLRDKLYCEDFVLLDLCECKREHLNGTHRVFRCGFPALMRVCRQIRYDFIPIFFGRVSVSIDLRDLYALDGKMQRKELQCLDKLCDDAIASLGGIEVASHSLCPSCSLRALVMTDVLHYVDRKSGQISSQLRSNAIGSTLSRDQCCWEAADQHNLRLDQDIIDLDLHNVDHRLCSADFKNLRRGTAMKHLHGDLRTLMLRAKENARMVKSHPMSKLRRMGSV